MGAPRAEDVDAVAAAAAALGETVEEAEEVSVSLFAKAKRDRPPALGASCLASPSAVLSSSAPPAPAESAMRSFMSSRRFSSRMRSSSSSERNVIPMRSILLRSASRSIFAEKRSKSEFANESMAHAGSSSSRLTGTLLPCFQSSRSRSRSRSR